MRARVSASPSCIEPWKQSPITTMIVGTVQPEALELLAELTQ